MADNPEAKGFRRFRRLRTRRHATNLHQEQAKPRKTAYTPAYYRQLYKRTGGWALIGLGLLLGGSHVITHLGAFSVLPRAGLQDLLMGYPMAGIIVIGGIALLSS